MNKKLIALAVAAAIAPVAAMADTGNVKIYGQMNASVDSVKSGYAGGDQRVTQVNDNSSRLGFTGTEDLGNGLTAVWQIESQISVDGATPGAGFQPTSATGSGTTVGARNTFVGLTGGFGTAVLGRHDTPYKLATRSLDVFADNIADNRSIMGLSGNGTTFDGRQPDVMAYISPTVGGFHGAIGYVAGAENALANGQTKGDAWSVVGVYANGPLFGSLAYEKHNVGGANTGTLGLGAASGLQEHAAKLGLGYSMDAFKVGLAYEKIGGSLSDAMGTGHHNLYLSGAYTMGSNALKLAYTKAGDMNASDTGAKQWSLGVDHNMSKRTTVYALYSKVTNDSGAGYGLTGGSNGGVAAGSLNSDPSVLSAGIKHSF